MTFHLRRPLGAAPQGRGLNAWCATIAFAVTCAIAPASHATDRVVPNDGSHSKISDPAATEETRSLYGFIKSRTTKVNSSLILGQHLGGPADLGESSPAFDMATYRIDSQTPSRHAYPRMIGGRYDANNEQGIYTLDKAVIQQINQRLIEVYNIYRPVVSITATPRNPWAQKQGRSFTDLDGSLASLSRKHLAGAPLGSPVRNFWDDVDTIADGLLALKTADGKPIPVVFRPFAEFNTEKYYFARKSSAEFRELWKEVADYYVNQRGLHNLIFTWEAWVWHRNPKFQPSQVDIAPWYPTPSVEFPNPFVDVVSGAFYFQSGDTALFDLKFTDPSPDADVFYALMNLAISNNKPFGAAQWAVNYPKREPCWRGDNNNTLRFMESLDDRHYVPAPTTQHLSFVYYWGDNHLCMAVHNQDHGMELIDDPRVATITGIDYVNTESGWIVESGAGSGKGGKVTPGLPLRTGDAAGNTQYKSILSFDTSATVLPADAVLADAPASLLLKKQAAAGRSPFSALGGLSIDAARVFGGSTALANDDFKARGDAAGVGLMSDPAGSFRGVAYGAVPVVQVNRTGRTQLRLGFQRATDGAGDDTFLDWSGIGTQGPELILTYTLPSH
ncbi:glycosyl hydrolase [Eleftheria terrae]|uniref:glycosyl hydrolase n=1 Tax=Eleftheria terrae TaxID=1597781 RepID=UPI00263AD61D|nr:glycosyl hydrolase [Eleftheria terrae]WKB54412.1 glycoside hydrolase family 26 protein [Eleftheria terrae]